MLTGGSFGREWPLSIRTAIGRRGGIFSHVIWITTMIGTERNIPITPHIQPQKMSDRITAAMENKKIKMGWIIHFA